MVKKRLPIEPGFIIPRVVVASFLFLAAAFLAFASFAGKTPSAARVSAEPKKAHGTDAQPPFPPTENKVTVGGLTVLAKMLATAGKVAPGGTFPVVITYNAGGAPVANATISVTLHDAAIFLNSTPAASSGNGTAGSPLTFTIPAVAANTGGEIVIEGRAKELNEDPEAMWKDISSNVTVSVTGQGSGAAKTHGPKVTTLETAVYGDRPFPIVMVQYQDVKHCTAAGTPFPECTGNHVSQALDVAVNSRTTGKSVWQLFQDMSFGQLFVEARVSPAPNSPTTPFAVGYPHKFTLPAPNGTCTGTTVGAAHGTPLYANRIENGWYLLPGTQGYYGADRTGHALLGAQTGQGLLFGIDDACGPTAKIVYDAASLADPDIDYNDFDTDKDGVVDFFNVLFAGDGGNGSTSPSGLNNIWPHSSDLRYSYTDTNSQTGYVSNDQFRNRFNQPMYFTDATRSAMTTTMTAFPVYVRVGPYNVNPEAAMDSVSVIAHEYGHSLGLPDFYSTGSRATFGSWELMGSDHFQYMTVFSRQDMGWIVPRALTSGLLTLRESKFDTGEIQWTRPDGTPYTLTGPGIHNADAYRVGLTPRILIDAVPSGVRAWYSGAGNDFGCARDGRGRNMDVFLPDLQQHATATAVTLKMKHLYEIEWDYDYAFVLVSEDGGRTWVSIPPKDQTSTPSAVNPNANGCQTTYGNSFTGVSDGDPLDDPVKRATGDYSGATFVPVEFDLSAYKGKMIILRFSYSTDPGLAKRGWFIDDVEITADTKVVYKSDFEASDERTRLFPQGWNRVTAAAGAPMDHAYYIELRDRISNDFAGKGQSDRGPATWEGGVSMIYTDEAHGYGNFGTDDPPAQTPVDSNPQPGNATPNLDDAAFTLARPQFNGCTHIDNYDINPIPDETEPHWKLPGGLRFNVVGMTGMSPGEAVPGTPATAQIVAEIFPDCNLQIAPPQLQLPLQYENPDTDGQYQVVWSRPAGAVGPDVLQVAEDCGEFLFENADDISDWTISTEGTFVGLQWSTTSDEKPNHAGSTFRVKASHGGVAPGPNANASAILKRTAPIAIPATGATTLIWQDWNVNEGDDGCFVEVSENGTVWNLVYGNSRSALAPDGAVAFEEEPLFTRQVDLSAYAGKSIHVRFRYFLGAENRAGSEPLGWYLDNIQVVSADWQDVISTPINSHVEHRATGTYCYRVRTTYLAGGSPILPSPFSNVISVDVAPGVFRAVSRKTHGTDAKSPVFDVDLPMTAASSAGIESRRGSGANANDHQVVFQFGAPVTIASASATPQAGKSGQVMGTSGNGTNEIVVNLGGVSNAQVITINLTGVSGAGTAANISVPMGVLLGDSNADRAVNSGDVQQTRNSSGQSAAAGNFRSDVNADGTVNSGDAFIVRAQSGSEIPPAAPPVQNQ